MVQPTVCSDGWASPSIGERGACSWHGGVGTNWSAILTSLFSVVGGLGIWGVIERENDKLREIERKHREQERQAQISQLKERAKSEGIDCPKCGYPLKRRAAIKGKNKGHAFLGCSRYPQCDGTRRI